ncbi:MAG TPA: hypothetical protein VG474_12400 [Solirubrobacteraceae bacterium]|nr:hypothetical protein [Solirubrobacteraceae bacterium]
MSYLSRPRIGFLATDATTNPSTANNENVIHFLDYERAVLLNPPAVESATLPHMSHAAYREWMTTLVTYSNPLPHPSNPPGPGNEPEWEPGMPGYWNYWGDHMTTWGSAAINSLWLPGADPVTSAGSDSLFGSRVVWHARIVDVDPADTWSTQFVSSGFSIIGPDASGELAELVCGIPTTSYTRWLNFFRYQGAGTFQSVIPNDGLTFIDNARAPESAAFAALRDGARAGGGLLLRYCFYGMKTQYSQQSQYDNFSAGGRQVNPKIGSVLGTIGVWNGRDLISTPVGRVLQQPTPPFFAPTEQADAGSAVPVALHVRTHADVEQLHEPGTHLHAESQLLQCIQSMGPAVAVVEDDAVVLDLLTAFPESGCDPSATGDPFDKHDFGPVSLELVYDSPAGSTTADLGPVSYDRETYESLAGVWEVPLDPSSEAAQHLRDGYLRLRDGAGNVLLREIEVAQVETDDRGIYVDLAPPAGGGTPTATGSLTLRAFTKGEPITAPLDVQVQFWVDVMTPGKANSINPLVVMACLLTNAEDTTGAYTVVDAGEEPSGTFHVTIPAGGELALKFTADTAGCFKLRFIVPGMTIDSTQPPAFAVEYYTNVRALPYHDYSDVPDEKVTLQYVFDEVLAYFSILYPVMSAIIPWGPENTPHDPDRVAQFAALMSMAIDESRIGTALQMPITRDLSAGKRALLQRWCALQMRTA